MVDGRIVIDREKCDGCGDCAKEDVCPQGLIRMIPRDATNFIPCSSTEEDDEVVCKTCGYGCIACGECERACPEGAVSIVDNHAVIDYDKCVGCVACAVKCKKKIIVDTLHDLTALKSTVAFVRCSGDGRIAFQLKNAGITTCQEAAKLDRKAMDEKLHRRVTGTGNANILAMARKLSDMGKPMWIRHVLVPGLTDSEDDLRQMAAFIGTLKTVERVEILPYHTLGLSKWKKLDIAYPLDGVPAPTADEVMRAERILGIC